MNQHLLQYEAQAEESGFKVIAGIDEAGRGPLAGPVVASAVILERTDFVERIDDSKKLSPGQRLRAYHEILNKAVIGIGIISSEIIDEINIYKATLRAMEEAVISLKVSPDYILIDGNMKPKVACHSLSIIKGDSKSLSIASASIIAKVTRDNIMMEYDKSYPEYGFARHKGYPTEEHVKRIRKYGLSPIHRRSFKCGEAE
ncbi:MAG: ribonuclease HII [Candidatus Omnitrophica bacterium]|nr:ribonuclease HII [Candidatus Omnitrophota bacterium]